MQSWGEVGLMLFFSLSGAAGEARRREGARGVRVINTGEAPLRLPLPPTPSTPSALQEKSWTRKDGGEQRAFGRRRCYLSVCVTGGAAVGRMLWSFSPCTPPPPALSPLSVRTHSRRFLRIFPCFLIPSSPLSPFFLPPFLPSSLPSSGERPLSPCSQRTLI